MATKRILIGNIRGPQGIQGEKGDTGPRGPQGEKGADGDAMQPAKTGRLGSVKPGKNLTVHEDGTLDAGTDPATTQSITTLQQQLASANNTIASLNSQLASVLDSLTRLVVPLQFTRSSGIGNTDIMACAGKVLILPHDPTHGIAFINARWVNAGAFHRDAWNGVTVASMVGWRNTAYERTSAAVCNHWANEFIRVQPQSSNIEFVNRDGGQVPADGWHDGCITLIVQRAIR